MDIKCYFVKLTALYSKKVLYGYNCNLDTLYSQIYEAKSFYTLEQNVDSCGLYGDVIDELNKFKRRINTTTTSDFCVDCKEPVELTCKDVTISLTNKVSGVFYTFYTTVTNATSPITYNWFYDTTVWSFVSQTNGNLVLEAIAPEGIPVYTNVGVSITDANGCLNSIYNFINYKNESPICISYTSDNCQSPNTVTLNSVGEYNGRLYYEVYCEDGITLVGYIFWNSILNRWEFRDELGSGTLYSYLTSNTYYPVGDWTNVLIDVAMITKALIGPCQIT